MSETDTVFRLWQDGALHEVAAWLDEEPRRVNRFLIRARDWGDEQWMPLHVAAGAGREDLVGLALDRGVSPDCRTRYVTPMHARQTPLHVAAGAGHGRVVEVLLKAGAEVEVRDAAQRSPLWLATRGAHVDCVDRLLQEAPMLEARDGQGRTALHAALLVDDAVVGVSEAKAIAAREQVVELLITAGADVNALCPRDPAGYTPLHRCVSLGESWVGVARRLVEAGADVSLADPRERRTAFALAKQQGAEAAWAWLAG